MYDKAAGTGISGVCYSVKDSSAVAAHTRSKTKLLSGNSFNSISNNSEASKFCSKPFWKIGKEREWKRSY